YRARSGDLHHGTLRRDAACRARRRRDQGRASGGRRPVSLVRRRPVEPAFPSPQPAQAQRRPGLYDPGRTQTAAFAHRACRRACHQCASRRGAAAHALPAPTARPGVGERLGIDEPPLARLNPKLVFCFITGFGADGPYANRAAYDNVGQALAGWISRFHDTDDARVAGPAISDAATGIFACLGIVSALLERTKTGVGRKVEVSMLEATLFFVVCTGAA